ncbi:M23 family metallopeptidase [Candidatus Chloroploca sp. Khr17]|uniref:M23 family metallopeptidase n=1 Tax=Candidatus Chloroploca sp. Khr17 TaxID=2496869 RepID=UPI00101BFAAF|nr:M23 family metallopeptidase [Candidatus Chloroploca sp. Khr17]
MKRLASAAYTLPVTIGLLLTVGLVATLRLPDERVAMQRVAATQATQCLPTVPLDDPAWDEPTARLFTANAPPATSLVNVTSAPAPAASETTTSAASAYPDTLLLYSNGWYGEPLSRAAQELGLDLTPDQLQTLEQAAILHGVNTRLLLVMAVLDQATPAHDEAAWQRWLAVQIARTRAALGPHAGAYVYVGDCEHGAIMPVSQTAELGLALLLSPLTQDGNVAPWQERFLTLYRAHFGDPTVDEFVPQQTREPFLIRPYNVPLLSRAYYDHTYPSVDNNKSPNIPGMLDYLGRTTTSYDTHDGDDFGMPIGTPIIAPAGGLLYNRLPSGASDGGLIIVSGAYEIVIWHMSAVYIGQPGSQVGVAVTQGQTLGLSGTAGGLPHIHFEVRYGGRQTNPMGWYGGGPDPCPLGPGPGGAYKGCVASVWLWLDQEPPGVPEPTPTATPSPTVTAEPSPTPSPTVASSPTATPTVTPSPTATPEPVVQPVLALSASEVTPGSEILVQGTNFEPYSELRLSINGSDLGIVASLGDGEVELILVTDPSASDGYYRVEVRASGMVSGETGTAQARAIYKLNSNGATHSVGPGAIIRFAVPPDIVPYAHEPFTWMPVIRR